MNVYIVAIGKTFIAIIIFSVIVFIIWWLFLYHPRWFISLLIIGFIVGTFISFLPDKKEPDEEEEDSEHINSKK